MQNIQWEKEVDVIVLGTGGAALSAAVAAADKGARQDSIGNQHQTDGR